MSEQLQEEGQSSIRNRPDSHSSLINTETLLPKVVKDELEVTSTIERERPNVNEQGQRKKPTSKQERIVCMILYSYNEKEQRSENNIRTNCMKGYSLRPKQFSEELRKLVSKGVYRPKRVGKGREKGQFVYELTDDGNDWAKWARNDKFFLDVLDLSTTCNFGGQGWKNKWTDPS